MSRLYQFISIAVVILILSFVTGCGGTATTTKNKTSEPVSKTVSSSVIAEMSPTQKLTYAERLFQSALSRQTLQKNKLLTDALSICTQVLTAADLSTEQLDHTQQLSTKIISQLEQEMLTTEQNNRYQLALAAISLKNFQASKTLDILKTVRFNSPEQLAATHKIRAMALFQLDQKANAIKELIVRQDYLDTDVQKRNNLNLIWHYVSSLSSYDTSSTAEQSSLSKNERIYKGWLELAAVLRDSHKPDTLNHAINFWLQSYPGHPADRSFIRQILQARQNAVLNIHHIAVLLPLQGKLAKPALAIRDGILASHYHSPINSDLELRFYDTGNDDHIWLTYQKAIDNGADFIIGPLAKSNLEVLAESSELNIPTLALNSLENPTAINTTPGINNLFQFGLSPEAEARNVARKGRLDGHYYAAIIAPQNHWGKRMQSAFSQQWQQSGGVIVDTAAYDPQAQDYSATIKTLLNIDQSEARKKQLSRTINRKVKFTPRRRQDIDMLFMAAFPRQAKQIPLQIIYHHGETIPVYSTAHIVSNYHSPKQNIDMDGVLFSDMPFLLGAKPDAVSLQSSSYQNTLYKRLFAMGVDSYQLAPYVRYLQTNTAESFAGDTGQLTIEPDGHIIRTMPWATFEQGNLMRLNSN